MDNKTKIIIAAIALLAAFAFGRWSAPDHVKEETKTTETDKKTDTTQSDTDHNKHTETTVIEVQRPDGTKEKTTKTVTDSETTKKVTQADTDQSSKTTDTVKEVDKDTSKVTISALAGVQLSFSSQSPVLYGGAISKPILGPITVGLWGLSNGAAGVSVGLTF